MSDDRDGRNRHLVLVVDNPPTPAHRRRLAGQERAFATRLQSIAYVLGVPVASFLRRPAEAIENSAGLDGTPGDEEIAEMQRLFREIQNADLRRQCLGVIRALSTIDRKSSV